MGKWFNSSKSQSSEVPDEVSALKTSISFYVFSPSSGSLFVILSLAQSLFYASLATCTHISLSLSYVVVKYIRVCSSHRAVGRLGDRPPIPFCPSCGKCGQPLQGLLPPQTAPGPGLPLSLSNMQSTDWMGHWVPPAQPHLGSLGWTILALVGGDSGLALQCSSSLCPILLPTAKNSLQDVDPWNPHVPQTPSPCVLRENPV